MQARTLSELAIMRLISLIPKTNISPPFFPLDPLSSTQEPRTTTTFILKSSSRRPSGPAAAGHGTRITRRTAVLRPCMPEASCTTRRYWRVSGRKISISSITAGTGSVSWATDSRNGRRKGEICLSMLPSEASRIRAVFMYKLISCSSFTSPHIISLSH